MAFGDRDFVSMLPVRIWGVVGGIFSIVSEDVTSGTWVKLNATDTRKLAIKIRLAVLVFGDEAKCKEERWLVQKLDFFILTYCCLRFFLNYRDRAAFANAYVAGLSESLNLGGNQYNASIYDYGRLCHRPNPPRNRHPENPTLNLVPMDVSSGPY
ncbi:hypothetical protein BDV12DRAFT_201186 [Aspergillus spectabilis]